MAQRLSEAERMHRHNAEMRLAIAEHLSLAEARWKLFQERMRAADDARDSRASYQPREATLGSRPVSRPDFWWERD